MRSITKTLALAGTASAAAGALLAAGMAARAETLPLAMSASAAMPGLTIAPSAPPPGTLGAQMASFGEAARSAPAIARAEAAPPTVALAHRLVEAAGAYALYMREAAAVQPGFRSAAHVVAALKAGGGYAPAQLEEGAAAYAAIVALQDPAFVAGVREWAATSPGEAPPVERLFSDPAQVLSMPGAAGAAGAASAALRAQGEALALAGRNVKQSAYGIQRQDWSKQHVPDPEARLAGLKAQAAAFIHPSDQDVSGALRAAVAFRPDAADAGAPPARVTPTIARALTLAAVAVLGGAGEENLDRLSAFTSEPHTSDCVKMSKLNLYQCMAVAGPEYEDVFCLGQHAMVDTGQCIAKAAGADLLRPALPQTQVAEAAPPSPAPAAAQSILVPVAFAAAGGAGH